MGRILKAAVAAAVLALAMWPAQGARMPVGGAVLDGYLVNTKGGCIDALEAMRLAGRMPVGQKSYTIVRTTSGYSPDYECDNFFLETGELTLVGYTPTGMTFRWLCSGTATWRHPVPDEDLEDPVGDLTDERGTGVGFSGVLTYHGACQTEGFAGTFKLRMLLVLAGDSYGHPEFGWRYQMRGSYWIKP